MSWVRNLLRRTTEVKDDPAARYVFDVAVKMGDVEGAVAILRSPGLCWWEEEELQILLRNLRKSPRSQKEKASHLLTLLRMPTIFMATQLDADALARELLELNPKLKPLVASQDIQAISGPYRIGLVRGMLEEKEFLPHEILHAIPQRVHRIDSWNVSFCQALVHYALEQGEAPTAYAAAARLQKRDLSGHTWETLMAQALVAVTQKVMTQEQLMQLAAIATSEE